MKPSYTLNDLGVARTLLTCFSNRLLTRLRSATATVEALMGVAFRWEAAVNTLLAMGNKAFVPTRAWFQQRFLHSRRHKRFVAHRQLQQLLMGKCSSHKLATGL